MLMGWRLMNDCSLCVCVLLAPCWDQLSRCKCGSGCVTLLYCVVAVCVPLAAATELANTLLRTKATRRAAVVIGYSLSALTEERPWALR